MTENHQKSQGHVQCRPCVLMRKLDYQQTKCWWGPCGFQPVFLELAAPFEGPILGLMVLGVYIEVPLVVESTISKRTM